MERLSCIPVEKRRSRAPLICLGLVAPPAFFSASQVVLLVFPAAIRRDGAVIPLIRPMPDREVASSNFSMETGG
ncbi:hypothetical protein [Burkholderia gladioli]|uniref:hypothetical protein n=1 Tax=Burkholderia gladioli TaxID=28095 RepID=UPI0011D1A63B|nr:hypothetical protein [Burkholderia gladioli]MBW5281927.1 hypothetical protein [Burkholderia gladioli]